MWRTHERCGITCVLAYRDNQAAGARAVEFAQVDSLPGAQNELAAADDEVVAGAEQA